MTTWLRVTIPEWQSEKIEQFHPHVHKSGSVIVSETEDSADSRSPTTFNDERQVTYHLEEKDEPEYKFGRLRSGMSDATWNHMTRKKPLDFVLVHGAGPHGRKSRISAKHFRVYFNTNEAWMFEDTSSQGCIIRGEELFSKSRRNGRSPTARSTVALHPSEPNVIDLRDFRIVIEVASEPTMPFVPDLSDLDLDAATSRTSTTASSFTTLVGGSTSLPVFDYHEVGRVDMNKVLLMSKADGRRLMGHEYPKTSIARRNFNDAKLTIASRTESDIACFVDFHEIGDHFIAITELLKGDPLDRYPLEPWLLSFIFVQILQKLAFLHSKDFRHGALTSAAILVSGIEFDEVHTNLVNVSLDQPSDMLTDLRALGEVIGSCFKEAGFDWTKSPLETYLSQCLVGSHEPHLSARLLEDITVKHNGGPSPIFEYDSILMSRTFELYWAMAEGPVVRRREIVEIIRVFGTPSVCHALQSLGDRGEADAATIEFRLAAMILKQHGLAQRLHHPPDLKRLGHGSSTFEVSRSISRHIRSGLWNITQVIKCLPLETPVVENLPDPELIQDVRGDPRTAGYYVSSSVDSVESILKDHIRISDEGTRVERGTRFETVDFDNNIIVPTKWAIPQFMTITRDMKHKSVPKQRHHHFRSLADCKAWLSKNHLYNEVEHLENLNQPFSRDWKTIQYAAEEVVCNCLQQDLPSPESSIASFHFSRRDSKVAQNADDAKAPQPGQKRKKADVVEAKTRSITSIGRRPF